VVGAKETGPPNAFGGLPRRSWGVIEGTGNLPDVKKKLPDHLQVVEMTFQRIQNCRDVYRPVRAGVHADSIDRPRLFQVVK